MKNSIDRDLNLIAKKMRENILRMAYLAGGAHISPAFSIVEILVAIYFGNILNYDPEKPEQPNRDRFILSKGHASTALYTVLAEAGYFDEAKLDNYCQEGSILGGHPNMHEIPGVEASTGAVGWAAGVEQGGVMAAEQSSKPR